MNSLFRIDRNSIHSSEIETAGMVVIPGFHELTEDQRTEKEQPRSGMRSRKIRSTRKKRS